MGIMSLNLMNYWRRMVLSVSITEILKRWILKYSNFWMDYPQKEWMKSSRLNRQKYFELYSRNPRTVTYGTDSVSFMAPKVWFMASKICPLKGRCWLRNKTVYWFIKLMNLQIVLCLTYCRVLGRRGLTLIGFL